VDKILKKKFLNPSDSKEKENLKAIETIQDPQLTEQVLGLVHNCKNEIGKLAQTMHPCRDGVRSGVVLDIILLLALGEGMLGRELETPSSSGNLSDGESIKS